MWNIIEYRRYFNENKVATLLLKQSRHIIGHLVFIQCCQEGSCKESLVSLNNDDLLTFLGND